ncbi:MAG: sodium-dependent transporter [Tepidanaerobacter acetatoxydans]|uniref:sodium-dependent transporter n=1 Tax=Tepidanaerobacter TaxID=499228 RepID=UPI000AE34939|nr:MULTISPECIES: sodium-dependent transporter [Tepidanaerobacter]NLU09720.1 sodium-dependent transporter [Tepidanaerobacter acetatoxydans]
MESNETVKNERGQWASSFGFVMAAAGAAIGLGNVWKFPYLTAKFGGGTFLFAYILMLLFLGIPVLITEMVLGRRGKLDPVGTYSKLSGGSSLWKFVGYVAIAVNFIVLSFYGVVGGWITNYMFQYITGGIKGDIVGYFGSFVSNPYAPLLWYAIFMGLTIYIVARGVSDGIEKASNILMPILFVLFIILSIRAVTLPGASKGLKYYLLPDFSELSGTTFLMAMGQVFFSLNIGAGCTMTYASYLSENENIPKLANIVPVMDFLAAFLAGMIVIPSVFAFNLDPAAGPPLLFITMPFVFEKMPLGVLFGLLFFVLMLFAALTSAISMLEVNTALLVDNYKMDRKKAALIAGTLIFMLGVPSSLSQGILANFKIFGLDFLSAMDFLASYILMPFGAFMMTLFVVRVLGIDEAIKEATNDGTIPFGLEKIWSFLVKYVVPVIIFLVFLSSVGIIKI